MAQWDQELEELGRRIQDTIDRAVSSHDYQKLNQNIRQTVDRAVDLSGDALRRAKDSVSRPRQSTPQNPKQNLPVLYGRTGGKTAGALAKVAGGGVLTGVTVVAAVAGTVADLLLTGTVALGFPALVFFCPAGFSATSVSDCCWLRTASAEGMRMIEFFFNPVSLSVGLRAYISSTLTL